MSRFGDVARLGLRSASLDIRLLRGSILAPSEGLRLIAEKYVLLARHTFTPYVAGKSHTRFRGHPYYYESRFGVAALQAALVSHVGALDVSGVKDVRTVVDVGANVGYFALAMRAAFPTATIHCCEPVPTTLVILRSNVGHDDHVVVHEVAVSDTSGSAVMVTEASNSLVSKLGNTGSTHGDLAAGEYDGAVTVETQRLDDLVSELGLLTIDVLKIDTETFEDAVLDGATETLARTRWLFLEVTIEDNPRYTISSLLGRLSTSAYDFQLVSARNFAGRAEGPVPIWDALFRNTML